jgi:catechol 2,3-dioxygenase-like lactoylglutathione lyase family enzyme
MIRSFVHNLIDHTIGISSRSEMNLNQITLAVTDLDRSIKYYQSLGLKLIVSSGNPYARFELPEGNSTLSLHVVDDPPVAGGVQIYFEVPDVVKRVGELEAAGIQFDTPATDQRWLWTEAWMTDPDGHRLCVFHAGPNRKNPPWRLTAD